MYKNKDGEPSKQAECYDHSAEVGIWSEWSAEGPCEGNCPEDSFHKHYRTCSNGKCQGESVKNGRKCLKVNYTFSYEMKPSEPTLNFYDKIEGRQCSAGIVESEIAVFTEALGREWYTVRYNVGDYCHFPSFGKGWFDQIMDNGDHVQMGVECENEWNYEDYSIAKKGEKCRLICKNLSGTANLYKPIDEKRAHFKCRSPIPIFAFQNRKCHKDMVKFIIRDVYSYYDYYEDKYGSFSDEKSAKKTPETRGRKDGSITGRK